MEKSIDGTKSKTIVLFSFFLFWRLGCFDEQYKCVKSVTTLLNYHKEKLNENELE
jgi:hypothetical protein